MLCQLSPEISGEALDSNGNIESIGVSRTVFRPGDEVAEKRIPACAAVTLAISKPPWITGYFVCAHRVYTAGNRKLRSQDCGPRTNGGIKCWIGDSDLLFKMANEDRAVIELEKFKQ